MLPNNLQLQDIPIIEGKLVFSILKIPPKNSSLLFNISIDTDERFLYLPFFSDFGPLSLVQIHRFIKLINNLLETHPEKIQFYCSNQGQFISNAVLLISSFKMIKFKLTPEESFSTFAHLTPHLKPYRDASSFPSTYDLTVFSCLKGLYKANLLKWYDYENFPEEETAKFEQVENGDMNWIIPKKLLAFASPYETNIIRGGWKVCTPEDLLPIFHNFKISHVVRLCQKFYDENIFKLDGIKHSELYFIDGSVPPKDILINWLKIIESEEIVALHCKAGLGRTYISFFYFLFFTNIIVEL